MSEETGNKGRSRLKASFIAVVALSIVAAAIQALLVVLPGDGAETDAVAVAGDPPAAAVEQQVASEKAASSAASPAGADDASRREWERTLGRLRVDGGSFGKAQVDRIASAPPRRALAVDALDQYAIMPAGCEILALTSALGGLGLAADPEDIVRNYLEYGPSPEGYSGSPYGNGGGLPPCIAATANRWMDGNRAAYAAYDVTGSALGDLLKVCERGYPVLVWVTEGLVQPSLYSGGGDYPWFWPEHCVVLYGDSAEGYLVCDSIAGNVVRDHDLFADVFDRCGSMAVAILPSARGGR